MRRLRAGEWLGAIGGILAIVSLFALHWAWRTPHAGWWSYPPAPRALFTGAGAPAVDGWQAMPTLRWFVLIIAVLGVVIAVAQAVSRGASLPSTLDLLVAPLAGATTILLAIRLATTGAPLRFGAVVGIFAVALVTVGAFQALRTEQGWTPGPDRPVELVELFS